MGASPAISGAYLSVNAPLGPAASADTLQEAETWLRTALDLAVKLRALAFRLQAQMHLAYVAMMKGDEDKAVELLSQCPSFLCIICIAQGGWGRHTLSIPWPSTPRAGKTCHPTLNQRGA